MAVDLRDVTEEHLADVGVDAVVHLGALCNDPLGNLNPSLTYDVNHLATVRLAEAAKAAGIERFLFASSCSLYGVGETDVPLDESADFAPLTPYGESKILAERDLAALADDDFSPVFLRNATAYGFSPRLRGDLVVNDLVAHTSAQRRGSPPQRWHGVAAVGPRRGHRRGLRRVARGVPRPHSRTGLQRRSDERELPHP